VLELEYTLIPHGLHVVGEAPSVEQRVEMLQAVADASHAARPDKSVLEAIVRGDAIESFSAPADATLLGTRCDRCLAGAGHEYPASWMRSTASSCARARRRSVRTPAILPTGRNLHGFDPFRIPSAYAVQDGALQAQRLIDKHVAEGNRLPESVAIVLWGTDNLKNEGAPIAQVLALIGARPRFDGYGR